MAITSSFNNPDLLLANFLLGAEKRFRNAVRIDQKEIEEKLIVTATEFLQKWAAEKLWKTGYEAELLKFCGKKFDFDNEIGIALSLDLNHIPPTVRQFCYQYVRLAEITQKENALLEKEIKQLQNELQMPFYKKWWQKIKPPRCLSGDK